MRKKIPLYHDLSDDCVPLIILSKKPRGSLIIYCIISYYLLYYVFFYIARLHVAETDVQYSEAGTQIHALALDLHKFKQFSWYMSSTVNITYNTKARIFGEQKAEKYFPTCPIIVYCTHRYIVFRRISKQHIFRFQNIYNVGGNITHLTENIPCLPFWNWIALLIIGKPILILTMTVVSWIANTKAQI